jgi:Bor protein
MRLRQLWVAVVVLATSACFHQTIQSGLTPATTVIERPFVATWLWGLVPAEPIDTRQSCGSGVATVETQQSFMNGLVGALTLGIYSPQRVRITCAS